MSFIPDFSKEKNLMFSCYSQILFACCLAAVHCDQQAEPTEVQSSNKLTSTKSSLNAIPSGPAQKTTVLQQQSHQYIPQYVVQKPTAILSSQHPSLHQQHIQHGGGQTAMFIIAQPAPSGGHGGLAGHGSQGGTQSPLFQQAVQQLLSYYSSNPQARYQLLHQQGGPSSGSSGQGVAVPQTAFGGPQVYHHPQMPSGALHVIPSPHLETSQQQAALAAAQSQHAQAAIQPQYIQQSQPQHIQQTQLQQQNQQHQQPQAIYAIPASSQITLNSISPGLLAQLTGQNQQQQQQQQPQQQQHVQYQSPQSLQAQLGSAQFFSHLPAQFGGQFANAGHPQLPSQAQYSFGSQFPGFQLSQYNQLSQQPQFSFKQGAAPQSASEYAAIAQLAPQIAQLATQQSQNEKNTQASSSNYTPIYRTAYIKG